MRSSPASSNVTNLRSYNAPLSRVTPIYSDIGQIRILTLKGTDTVSPTYKAPFVVQGHGDREKHMMVHNSSTTRPASVHLLVSVAAMLKFRLRSFGVTKAYLQITTNMVRSVYVRPPRERANPETHLMLLRKAFYGLSDLGDYWNYSIDRVLREDVGLEPSKRDPALYCDGPNATSSLNGTVVTQVDDVLSTGSPTHRRSLCFEHKLDSKPRDTPLLHFLASRFLRYENLVTSFTSRSTPCI